MNLIHAEVTAKILIKKHCPDYSFKWDDASRRFGQCNYIKKTISISRKITELNTEEHFTDTVLHEIAHAISPRDAGHGTVWKLACIKLGCRPKRCYSNSVITPNIPFKSGYTATCPNCHRETYYKVQRLVSCGRCSRVFNPNYKLIFKKNEQ